MVELNFFCHPCLKQECKLLKLPTKNSQTVTSLQGKVQNLHTVQRTISGGEEALLKANRMNLLCCPFVAALQISCPRELTILWTFAVWSSAVTNKRYFRQLFSSIGRTSDYRMKSSVGSHGKFLKYRATCCTMSVEPSSYASVTARSVLTSELYTMYDLNFPPLLSEQNARRCHFSLTFFPSFSAL